jgi:hypothetical protein
MIKTVSPSITLDSPNDYYLEGNWPIMRYDDPNVTQLELSHFR